MIHAEQPIPWNRRQASRRFLVIVIDPKRRVAFPVSVQEVFDLTKSERCLASNLANGVTMEDTARTILKPAFFKVGVERQADLTRIVLGFPEVDPDGFA